MELWDRADLLVSSQLVYPEARANGQLRIVSIDEPLARHAGDLVGEHAGDDIVLATWDSALNSAARATGRLVANDI